MDMNAANLLSKLVGTSQGPVAFGNGQATLSGDVFDLHDEQGMVRIERSAPARLPLGDYQAQIGAGLAQLELNTRHLARCTAADDSITVEVWVSADTAAHDLALAVRDARALLAVGQDSIMQLTQLADSMATLEETDREARQQLAVAEQAAAEFREKVVDLPTEPEDAVPHEPPDSSSEDLPSPPTPPDSVAWCYVSAPTDVLDLQSSDRTVGQLVPGHWYQLKSQTDGWAHIADPESGLEGWVPGDSVSVR